MGSLSSVILKILWVIYIFLAYLFLFPGFFEFMLGKHSFREKVEQFIAFLLTPPLFLPLIIIFWVGWHIMRLTLVAIAIILFSLVSALYVVNVHFPFGGVFQTWLVASRWVLAKVRGFLELTRDFQLPRALVRVPLQ